MNRDNKLSLIFTICLIFILLFNISFISGAVKELDYIEYSSDSSARLAFPSSAVAVGGTVIDSTDYFPYTAHVFTSNGNLIFPSSFPVRLLVVAGGGAGGGTGGESVAGGGGAGGVYANIAFSVSEGSKTITVGAGGTTSTIRGGNSSFDSTIVVGGGRGSHLDGSSGGSGGGAGELQTAGTGISGQGHDGAVGYINAFVPHYGRGGGGGGWGLSGSSEGLGGNGSAKGYSGTSVYYGGGGSGTCYRADANPCPSIPGGLGGGGNGAGKDYSCTNGVDGLGGGGGGNIDGAGCVGGSGVVIVGYNPYLQSYKESTIKTQGTYSLKIFAFITSSLNHNITRTLGSPVDLTGKDYLNFAIRASRTGSNIKLGFHDSGGTTTEITPNIVSADTWQNVSLVISGVANSNKDAMDNIIITIMNADANNTFYLDDIRAIDSTLNLTYPLNNSFLSSASINLTANITGGESLGMKNVSLYINGVLNTTTLFSAGTARVTFGNALNFLEGIYSWYYRAYDWAENLYTVNANNTFTFDITKPLAVLNSPANNLNISVGFANLTVNITENVRLTNATLYIYNQTGNLINKTLVNYSGNTISSNLGIRLNLTDGIYTWYYRVSDIASNYNTTENRTFILDYNAPTITINYPTNNQLLTVKPTSLNFTSFDYPAGLDECWYGYNDLEYGYTEPSHVDCNTLFSPGINYSSEGDNTWYLYAKDNWGQIRGTTLNFTVYTEKPRVIYNPNTFSSGNYSASNIFVNVTFVGNSFANVTIYIYNSSGWSDYLFNYSANSSNSISKNFGGLLDGTYFINATCVDLANNYNYTDTRIIRLDRTKPLLSFGDNNPVDNANSSVRNIYVNVSSNDAYFANVTFTLTNSTPSTVYSTTYTGSTRSINWSVSYDDAFDYTVLATDFSNNQNTTSRRINIDTLGPINSNSYSVTGSTSADIYANIGDTPAGVSNVWISLYDSNGNFINNFSMSRNSGNALSGNYNSTITGLTEGGDYEALIFSNDTLNTPSNSSINFDLYPIVDFSAILSYDTNYYNSNFRFDRAGTSQNMISNFTSESSYSFSIKKRTYDFNLSFENNTMIFRNINVTGNASINVQSIKGDTIANVSGYTILGITAVELTNLTLINIAELILDYSGKFTGSGHAITESGLTIHKCANWNFVSSDCDGTWSLVSGTAINITADKIYINVSSFSAYAITESLGSTGDEDTTPATAPAGGGGGGGGGTPSTNSLSFSTASIEKSVMVGTNGKIEIAITNTKSTSSVAQLSVEGDVASIVQIEKVNVEIPGLNSGLGVFKIYGVREAVYTGYFVIKSNSATTKIPVTILVSGKNDKLLDLSVRLDEKKVQPGDEIEFTISAFNLGRLSRYDLNIQSEVINLKTNQTLVSNQEAIAIETSLNLERTLQIPEDAEVGDYVLIVRAFYDELSATAMSKFSVYKSWTIPLPTFIKENLPLALAILFLIIVSVISYYYFSFIRKKLFEKEMAELRKKSPYPFPDFYALPKSKFAYIGMVADARVKTYLDYTQLNRHTLIAGGTGSGKTIAGMVIAEELLKRKSSVVVFDPVGQWTGFAKKNAEKIMTSKFRKFKMFSSHAFSPRIINITKETMNVDILEYMRLGGMTVFKLNELTPQNADIFIEHCLNRIYRGNLSESSSLKTLLVLDEVHRLLPKYGGRHAYLKLEQSVREFRKWGIGLLMISQVLTDFKGAIRGNIGTEIQMFSRYEGDVKRVRERHGAEVSTLIPKLPVGLGMVEAGGYNKGNPYFVEFRPIYHSPLKLTDAEMKKYLEKKPYLEKNETVEEKKIRDQMEKDNAKTARALRSGDMKKERDENRQEKEAEQERKHEEKSKEKIVHTGHKSDLNKNKHIKKMFNVKHHDKEKSRKKEDVKVIKKNSEPKSEISDRGNALLGK